jgi:hypothetical protein
MTTLRGLESQQNVFRENPMTVSLHWGEVIYGVAHLLAKESKPFTERFRRKCAKHNARHLCGKLICLKYYNLVSTVTRRVEDISSDLLNLDKEEFESL